MLVIRSGFSNFTLFLIGAGVFMAAILIGEITYRVIEKRLISITTAATPIPTKLKKT
jgi:peptidoglycan/LPS O-acetylase OafA/YrhL